MTTDPRPYDRRDRTVFHKASLFPEDSAARKEYPVYSGFVQYFPSAMAAIAHHSYVSNEKHNPGLPLQWDRSKSDDEKDAQLRHLMEGDEVGAAWRAMAVCQKHLEANGAPIAPAARNAIQPVPVEPPLTLAEELAELGSDELPLNNGSAAE